MALEVAAPDTVSPVTKGRAIPLLVLALALAGCGGDSPAEPPAPTVPTPTAPPAPPPPPDPPGIPIVRLAAEGTDYVEWEWDAVEGATLYRVDLAEGDELANRRQTSTEATRYRWEGLPPDQLVVIWVRAVAETAGGRAVSDWSRRIWGVTAPETAPVPRECSDERDRVERLPAAVVPEWDGTPFRVDVIDNFPHPRADVVTHILEPVAQAAAIIERQLGYPIIERGELIPAPEGVAPGWNADLGAYTEDCPLPRDRGQIIGFFMADRLETSANALAHSSRCGTFAYLDVPGARLNAGTTIHEIWHLFGFVHHHQHDPVEERGVPMSKRLTRSGDRTTEQTLTHADVDILRCIFPDR